jgi:cellobiose-specific phosphotransferase system component IIC
MNFAFGAITVAVVARLTSRSRHAMLVPTTIIAMVAMLMDSLAVTLDTAGYTYIYANTVEHAAYAGGTLLFAFWSAFFFALLWHRPKEA